MHETLIKTDRSRSQKSKLKNYFSLKIRKEKKKYNKHAGHGGIAIPNHFSSLAYAWVRHLLIYVTHGERLSHFN